MSCSQEINIINEAPITAADISWPLDFEAECGTASLLTPAAIELERGAAFARPSFSGADNCSLFGYDFEDDFFASNPSEPNCGVLQRRWTAIDWCTQVNGSFAIFEFTQNIEVNDDLAPILVAVSDTTITSNNASCTSSEFLLTRAVGPDCTCLLYTSPSPRDATLSRMPSSA